MKNKLRLIIPDADVVIDLVRLDLWKHFVQKYDVIVAETVVNESILAKSGEFGEKLVAIDLEKDAQSGIITIESANASDLVQMQEIAKQFAAPAIHDGELETTGIVFKRAQDDDIKLCLIDEAAIKYAVLIGLKDNCTSVEDALCQVGLGKKMDWKLSARRFRTIVDSAFTERVQKL